MLDPERAGFPRGLVAESHGCHLEDRRSVGFEVGDVDQLAAIIVVVIRIEDEIVTFSQQSLDSPDGLRDVLPQAGFETSHDNNRFPVDKQRIAEKLLEKPDFQARDNSMVPCSVLFHT